ncbi:sulfhydryl oxidase 1-like isoform X1 [Pieris brassicae]|uniref:sulfhydryl oxidase 1-like isoform X1 n=1 Tax=Pieris brassicae TaxID=7116 RepID=UPI001E66118A|nr:sulfhydryl oxidase 1-like isoform X1 [Pieris brassicae]XP_045531047.1 sulfhydryl oxidase 1-like isoform X1 [Pieris brassicae]
MYSWCLITYCAFFFIILSNGAVLRDDDVDHQGLYSKADQVTILTNQNFNKKIYGQRNAYLVQFYNSYCGHCRAFAPKFKNLAAEIASWENIIKLAVIDCSVEENNEICRQFEVMAYPSLRYLHEKYVIGNAFVGDNFMSGDTVDKLKAQLIMKMQSEQSLGRLLFAPHLGISAYGSYAAALNTVSANVVYTFLVFESENSTVGSELALDINDYKNIDVRRVYENSELATIASVTQYPGIVAVESTLKVTRLTPKSPTKQNLLKAVNTFLKSKDFIFPVRSKVIEDNSGSFIFSETSTAESDIIYYSDLERTLKTSLLTEISRHKMLSGDVLQALLNYLNVLIVSFPARKNLKDYLTDLHNTLATKNEWSGSEVYELVKSREAAHEPVYTSNSDYIGCKGSQPQYRGYTCGLWILFHTLTVNAAQKPGLEGPRVLSAIHGYVKHFFGCTECSQHFQAMAEKNKIFQITENDKAVLWLWIAHNEVNLRLAGDVTEDSKHPKIQYPSVDNCPKCRLTRGAWNLPAVYEYLQKVYDADNIRDLRKARSTATAQSPLSSLDIGMLSLLLLHRVWRIFL